MKKSLIAERPEKFEETICLLADLLKSYQYAFRGTTSLVLQEIEMNIDDIDILCDKAAALECNKLLKNFLVEEIFYKESEKFKSYYGKFEVNKIPVEIMGEWEIKDAKGNWVGPFNASERRRVAFDGKKVYVTTIELELLVFAKMGRWNAYHKIRKQEEKLKEQDQQNLFSKREDPPAQRGG